MKVIKWAYRYGSLQAENFDTLEDAVAAASWASDAGEESLKSFEVFGDEYRLIDEKEAYDLMHAYSDAEYEKWRERTKDEPKVTHIIDVKGPNGVWACWQNGYGLDDASAKASAVAATVGAERVQVRPVGTLRR